ncbi:hypothetical protein [Spectribacter hydrogenoxidans]|uniref:Methyltransferase n=1 Tax=Spectribacter hydrogenoxidans TaxID=3075608 RepID=A0ABU3BWQ0_9GAMM|nr:hypothetical protein [Salinisphaera sp. W335]MDT0633713.1 hypothetical protein [Salinisphaera sp. W335]
MKLGAMAATLAAAWCMTGCAGTPTADDGYQPTTAAGKQLARVARGDHRSDANIARNQYRHPVQTLQFFGVAPDMTVVEIWPGTGWYTEILAPYLRDSGTFYAAGFSLRSVTVPEYRERIQREYVAKLRDNPGVYDRVKPTAMGPPEDWRVAPENSADRVLTFRNVHNWIKDGYASLVFDGMYEALKPGGILGVVEHRAKPGTSLDAMKASGYVTEQHVKLLAARSGFEFVESSEINANPKDTADHPEGVWTLPPTLRLGDKDRQKYLEIGESDRMTLKFRKPAG